jgi:hypothetical protein
MFTVKSVKIYDYTIISSTALNECCVHNLKMKIKHSPCKTDEYFSGYNKIFLIGRNVVKPGTY